MKAWLKVSLVLALLGLGMWSAFAAKQTTAREGPPPAGVISTAKPTVLSPTGTVQAADEFMVIGADISSAMPMSFTPVENSGPDSGQ
jgi:hypothetical protein